MKKKLYPRKSCKWIIEAKWNDPGFKPKEARLYEWHRIAFQALGDGRIRYDVAPSRPQRLMPAYPLEVIIAKAREEHWNSYYEFRFKNIRTKETIPFALFEMEYADKETYS